MLGAGLYINKWSKIDNQRKNGSPGGSKDSGLAAINAQWSYANTKTLSQKEITSYNY